MTPATCRASECEEPTFEEHCVPCCKSYTDNCHHRDIPGLCKDHARAFNQFVWRKTDYEEGRCTLEIWLKEQE